MSFFSIFLSFQKKTTTAKPFRVGRDDHEYVCGFVCARTAGEKQRTIISLHQRLKGVHVLGFPQQLQHARLVGVPCQRVVGEIALEAARVVGEFPAGRVGGRVVDDYESVGPKVDGEVGKGAVGDTASAGPVRKDFRERVLVSFFGRGARGWLANYLLTSPVVFALRITTSSSV